MINEDTEPINGSLQLRSQYSQDEAECKLMLEKSAGFLLILPGRSDFTTSGSQNLENIGFRAIKVSSE